ncbi:hypothetical protein B0H13DRAFT_2493885 [Mycena leptocephala]|nr:hypothetical protein B0H13DRAFT_2493885 [Mycena leptocephala]
MNIAPPGTDANSQLEQHWQLDWMCGGITMTIYLSPALDSAVIPALFPDRNYDMPELNSLPTPTPLTEHDMFIIEWLRGMIKDRAPAAAATSFSLTSNKYHRLPEIMDAMTHFNYFIQLHGSQPIPNVTLEMHRTEGPIENREVSNDIFHDNVAEVQEGKKYGFTICNGSPYDLFAYLFYFDPAECTIQAWHVSETSLPASDGIQATRCPVGYGPGVPAFEFFLAEGKTPVDSGFVKLFISTEELDMDWIVQTSPFKSNSGPSVRLAAGREKIDRGQSANTKARSWSNREDCARNGANHHLRISAHNTTRRDERAADMRRAGLRPGTCRTYGRRRHTGRGRGMQARKSGHTAVACPQVQDSRDHFQHLIARASSKAATRAAAPPSTASKTEKERRVDGLRAYGSTTHETKKDDI